MLASAFALLFIALCANAERCTHGGIYFSETNKCYWFSHWSEDKVFLSWDDAQDQCNSMDGDLVSIHSKTEQEFIDMNALPGVTTWIGFNSFGNDKIEDYMWSDYTRTDYTNWHDKQSKNKAERCVYNHQGKGWGNGNSCGSVGLMYTCEVPILGCSAGTISYTNWVYPNYISCFQVNTIAASWNDSRARCLQQGGDLTSVHPETNNFLYQTANSYGLQAYWNGLNMVLDPSKNFTWSDNSPLDFTLWDDSVPGSCNDGPQACANSNLAGRWFNCWSCDHSLPSICQMTPVPAKYTGNAVVLTEKIQSSSVVQKKLAGKGRYNRQNSDTDNLSL